MHTHVQLAVDDSLAVECAEQQQAHDAVERQCPRHWHHPDCAVPVSRARSGDSAGRVVVEWVTVVFVRWSEAGELARDN